MNERPIRLIISDDLQRNRLTVFLRLLLAIPHLLWLIAWGVAAFFAVIVNWFATLIRGVSPEGLHEFLAQYVRYAIHVYAYLFLAADPYPDFLGKPGYPVDVEIAAPREQNRWTVALRIVLAIPAVMIAGTLASSGARNLGFHYGFGLLGAAAFLGWFVALVQARMPRGLRDAIAYALSYTAQLDAYLLLLTDHYPNSDPLLAVPNLPSREDPIELTVSDDLERDRLTVFLRLLLAIPHLIWLALWSIAAWLAAIVNWFATLIRGTSPEGLHRFLAAYVRYQTHVYAYLFLIADPFPAFTGREGSYRVEATIEGPREQNRWIVGFRVILVLPALLIGSAYGGLITIVAFLGWFAALANGHMPLGLRNAGALAIRYLAQLSGYELLLTDAYPYSGPTAPGPAVPDVSTASAPLPA